MLIVADNFEQAHSLLSVQSEPGFNAGKFCWCPPGSPRVSPRGGGDPDFRNFQFRKRWKRHHGSY